MPKFTTVYRDPRTGLPHLSQIEATSNQEAEGLALRRGLGERITSRGPEGVDRARTAEPSARLQGFLQDPNLPAGLDALDALAHLAHLAASGEARVDLIGLLSDAGLFQRMLRVVRESLFRGPEPMEAAALLHQLRVLEEHVKGLPSEVSEASLPVDRRNPAAEIGRLRALLLQVIFDLERLAVEPTRNEADRQALHDRAQSLRWGLSNAAPSPEEK